MFFYDINAYKLLVFINLMKKGLYNHLDLELLKFVGIRKFKDSFYKDKSLSGRFYKDKSLSGIALHFELSPNINVAFIEILRTFSSRKKFEYHFGIFKGSFFNNQNKSDLEKFRIKLDTIVFKTPIRKANELNNFLLGMLFREGHEKAIKNYYESLDLGLIA